MKIISRCCPLVAGLFAAALVSPATGADKKTAVKEEAAVQEKADYPVHGKIVRLDPALDAIVPKEAKMERLADGFEWSEGPVWSKSGKYLLFSDIPPNRINKWAPASGISVFIERAGYTGEEKFTGKEPGTNGLAFDAKGNLITCAHGDRVVRMIEGGKADGKRVVLAAKYDGKRLNSPNDLAIKSNGEIYFTDPPYGLPKQYDDPGRELDWCGVYRIGKGGKLTLLTKEMTRPNGIAFSPDEKTLYVANSDPKLAIWKAFPVKDDGTLGEGKVLLDVTKHVGQWPGLPDGLKVDQKGNLYATGPGGVWILSAEGKPLGRLDTGEATANCAWGDDGSTLYITADMYLLRILLGASGVGDLGAKLPAGEARPVAAGPKTLVINVDREERLFVDSKELSLADLGKLIAGFAAGGAEGKKVRIQADKDTRTGSVQDVIELCQKHGLGSFSLAINPAAD